MSFDIKAVSVDSAVLWAQGKIHDSRLDVSRQEIVFWNELDAITDYPKALAEVVRLAQAGCPAMIVHACHPVVWRKLDREGSTVTYLEEIVWRGDRLPARRYVVPPLVFSKWVKKLGVRTADHFIKAALIES